MSEPYDHNKWMREFQEAGRVKSGAKLMARGGIIKRPAFSLNYGHHASILVGPTPEAKAVNIVNLANREEIEKEMKEVEGKPGVYYRGIDFADTEEPGVATFVEVELNGKKEIRRVIDYKGHSVKDAAAAVKTLSKASGMSKKHAEEAINKVLGGIVKKPVRAMLGCYNSDNDREAVVPLPDRWPSKLRKEKLDELKRDLSPEVFKKEYLNQHPDDKPFEETQPALFADTIRLRNIEIQALKKDIKSMNDALVRELDERVAAQKNACRFKEDRDDLKTRYEKVVAENKEFRKSQEGKPSALDEEFQYMGLQKLIERNAVETNLRTPLKTVEEIASRAKEPNYFYSSEIQVLLDRIIDMSNASVIGVDAVGANGEMIEFKTALEDFGPSQENYYRLMSERMMKERDAVKKESRQSNDYLMKVIDHNHKCLAEKSREIDEMKKTWLNPDALLTSEKPFSTADEMRRVTDKMLRVKND